LKESEKEKQMQDIHQITTPGGQFRIQVGGTDLAFRDVRLSDPVPTGKQIIEAAGGHPADEFIVLQWLADNDLEELDRDETTDLRKPGAERFIVARSDRTFRFEIDGRKHEWPEKLITRDVLLDLAGQDKEKFSAWQELRDAADREVLSGHPADLGEKGTERFYTVMKHTTEGGMYERPTL
jgi:hypothetical protein